MALHPASARPKAVPRPQDEIVSWHGVRPPGTAERLSGLTLHARQRNMAETQCVRPRTGHDLSRAGSRNDATDGQTSPRPYDPARPSGHPTVRASETPMNLSWKNRASNTPSQTWNEPSSAVRGVPCPGANPKTPSHYRSRQRTRVAEICRPRMRRFMQQQSPKPLHGICAGTRLTLASQCQPNIRTE